MGNAAPRANLGGQIGDPKLYLSHDLPKFIFHGQLGHGKFMKSYLTRVDGVLSLVKVYIRPPDEDLSNQAEKLSQLLLTLSPKDHPNVLPYQMWLQSTYRAGKALPSPIYLGRQYLMANLYDRLATRPFLAPIEKKWVIYQLFRAVELCHRKDVIHGDIKLENIMITSWNWLVLTDFAPYKPTYLPDDDPTDFHYYFDASDRRRCAIAPERFCAVADSRTNNTEPLSDLKQLDESPAGRVLDGPCLPSMDVFSLGCAIVEILLDGEVLLDLPALLQYRANKLERLDAQGSPVASKLGRIEDATLREVLCHMTQKDPQQRKTVREYREMLQEAGYFPSYFESFLYDLALRLHKEGLTPDDRVALLCKEYGSSILAMTGVEDDEGVDFFRRTLAGLDLHVEVPPPTAAGDETKAEDEAKASAAAASQPAKPTPKQQQPTLQDVIAMSQDLLAQIDAEIAAIREHGKVENGSTSKATTTAARWIETARQASFSSAHIIDPSEGFLQKVASTPDGAADALQSSGRKAFHGPVLLLQMLCSSIRHVRFPQTKLIALHLLVRLGMLCSDNALLQRVVPYIVELLEDQVASVRAIAVRSLCAVVSVVETFSALDAGLFPLYIFPAVGQLVRDSDDIVRVAFANSIASLAEASKRFLDRSHFITQSRTLAEQPEDTRASGAGLHSTIIESSYDKQLGRLHDTVAKWFRELLSEGGPAQTGRTSSSLAKRVLMRDILRLCYFFGEENVEENLLQLFLTVLNDVDWELRRDFCAQIPSVCAFLGPTVTAEFALPCIENALFDGEELVVVEALRSLVSLVELQLLTRQLILGNIRTITPLLLHPRQSIREFAMRFVVASAKELGRPDTYALLLPLLRPVLTYDLVGADLTLELLTSAVEEPISRKAYRRWLHEHASRQGLITADSISTESTGAGQHDEMGDMLGVVGFDSEEIVASSAGSSVLPGNSPLLQSGTSYNSPPDFAGHARAREKSVAAFRSAGGRHGSVATNATGTTAYSTLDDIRKTEGLLDNDVRKFPIMRPYIEALSREIHTKANTWSSAVKQPRTIRGRRVDSPLDAVALSISESNAQSILVPNQRSAVIPTAPDQSRGVAQNLSEITDVRELRKAYALTTTAADAARVALVDDDQGEDAPLTRAPSRKMNSNDRLRRMESGDAANDESKFFSDDRVDAKLQDPKTLAKRLAALDVPPLPPDLGTLMQPDGRKFSIHLESVNTESAVDLQTRAGWRPRQGVLAATFSEHSRSVNRLAVAPDQTFFISASDDRTAKVWSLRGLESAVAPRSTLTYAMHKGRVIDACILENTHSVATCSDDGSVHVWRVDVEMDNYHAHRHQSSEGGNRHAGVSVIGTSVVKTIDANEGPIVNVHHFNSDRASVLMYTTQRGIVHTWDLRASTEPFQFHVRPELGYLTSMTMGHDRNWVCVGTSRGYIALYDIRYNVMAKLWQHSARQPIHRLASSKSLPRGPKHTIPDDGSYLFVAAGNNEAVVWGIPGGGECIRCFRTTPLTESRGPPAPLPVLEDIPLPAHPNSPIPQAMTSFLSDPVVQPLDPGVEDHSVRAIMGRITSSGSSYLVTAGTDKNIRFWDFHHTAKCYTISGLLPGQPKPAFETPRTEGLHDRLFTCYDATMPTPETTIAAHLPQRQQRGPIPASTNHRDAVLDLKMVELPMKMMLSCSRDGDIKGWR